ncbi:hypothetical protein CC2G_008282 [Coprinopsis cinerea AmutBmut pab1-1]|nr:hypothetical protein CC2G_008282 [Coprinopsis cinerea AmutBmut pab1-1]
MATQAILLASTAVTLLNGTGLPAELLTLVFDYIARPWFDFSLPETCRTLRDIHTCLAPLRLVCRRWNRIIETSAWYWSTLEFGGAVPIDFLIVCFERSQKFDLTIILYVPSRSRSKALHELLQLACAGGPRIKRLDIRLFSFSDATVLDKLLHVASSSLECLKLELSDKYDDGHDREGRHASHNIATNHTILAKVFEARFFAQLRQFSSSFLNHSILQVKRSAFFHHLTTLRLEDNKPATFAITLSDIYSILDAAYLSLTSLTIHDVVRVREIIPFTTSARQTLILPYVNDLSLTGDLVTNALLLNWIDPSILPLHATVYLSFEFDHAPWSPPVRAADWIDVMGPAMDAILKFVPQSDSPCEKITLVARKDSICAEFDGRRKDSNIILDLHLPGPTPKRQDWIISKVLHVVRQQQLTCSISSLSLILDVAPAVDNHRVLEELERIVLNTPRVNALSLAAPSLGDPFFSLLTTPRSFSKLNYLHICAPHRAFPVLRPSIWNRLGSFFAMREHHGIPRPAAITFEVPSGTDIQGYEELVVDLFASAKALYQAAGRVDLVDPWGKVLHKVGKFGLDVF